MGTGTLRQENAALLVLAAISLALITILSVWKLKRFKYRLVNETGGAMFYGILLGVAVKYLRFDGASSMENHVCTCPGLNSTPHLVMVNISSEAHCYRHVGKMNPKSSLDSTSHMETFDLDVLFNVFLPPIIFYGAYTLDQRRFIANLGSVLTFAFFGTLISCFCIGVCIYGVTRLMVLLGQAADGDYSFVDCLLFGAITSATDPVSILGLLSDLRVDLDLHTLLFGESVLNDAVAIVLTRAITTYDGARPAFDPSAFLYSIGSFLGILLGSFCMGFIFTSPLLETSVVLLLSWSSFLSAKASGLSGIVAVLFCGLSQARYTVLNLSAEGRSRTKQLFEVFSFLGEIFIYSCMGYILLTFPHHVFKALFISGAFLSIFISRACHIYPLSLLLNLGRTKKISCSFQHFMAFAGLRGAVAFSLAVRDTTTEAKQTILTTTLLLAGFTIWVLGAAADPLLHSLDIRMGEDSEEDSKDFSSEVAMRGPDTARGLWHNLDHKYLKPMLTHCGPPLTELFPRWCGAFARIFSPSQIQEDEEEFCEIEPHTPPLNLDKTEHPPTPDDDHSGSEHQDDLLEGDLGLGTGPVNTTEPSVDFV
ncbi:Sodium/hydrogen exchanger 9 [Oryzias melastigma]|uniref:Sodium/hydrogen exchanger 9 n=1 Tax=Oryzias melastigma TaxID=30732 RepID=A0A834F0K4_ORYME|nr:Sodium/hydrogen exchanger 9 [Oryzias melastigma]